MLATGYDRPVRTPVMVLCAALVATGTAGAGIVSFRMPSRNIECAEFTGARATLRCDIRSGVKPLPPKPASGFVCVSRASGLRCRNASRHGFFLSRQRSYAF